MNLCWMVALGYTTTMSLRGAAYSGDVAISSKIEDKYDNYTSKSCAEYKSLID